jgi:hypothetical protein
MNPNSESIPSSTIAIKNKNTQRLGQPKIANALGKILKLSSAPDKVKLLISKFYYRQKCPRYIKIFKAHSIPHTTILNGIIYIPSKYFYFFGFILDRLTTPAIPTFT